MRFSRQELGRMYDFFSVKYSVFYYINQNYMVVAEYGRELCSGRKVCQNNSVSHPIGRR